MIELGFVTKLTELEMHQLAYRLNGLKFYDANGNVVGVVNEALRTWDACSIDMRSQILEYTTRHSVYTTLPLYRVFGIVLEHFHIICPHLASCLSDTEYKEMVEFASKEGIEPPAPYKTCEICLERV